MSKITLISIVLAAFAITAIHADCLSSIDFAETTVSNAYNSGDMSQMMNVQKAFQSMVGSCMSVSSQCKVAMADFQSWAQGNTQASLSDIVSRLEDLKTTCGGSSTPSTDGNDCVNAVDSAETTVSNAYNSGDISQMMNVQKAFQSMAGICMSGSSQCKMAVANFQSWAKGNTQASLSEIISRLEDLKKACGGSSTPSTGGSTSPVTPSTGGSTSNTCVTAVDTAETTVSNAYNSGDMSQMMNVQKAFQSMVGACMSGSSQCKMAVANFQSWAQGNTQASLSDIVSRLEDLKTTCGDSTTPSNGGSTSNDCVSALDNAENVILEVAGNMDFSSLTKIQTAFQTMTQKCSSGSGQCRIQIANFASWAKGNTQADPSTIVSKIEDLKKVCA